MLKSSAASPSTRSESKRLKIALAHARDGQAVFPCWWPETDGPKNADGLYPCACGDPTCGDAGKHPIGELVPHGFKQATRDEKLIRKWWSKYPRANIAGATGDGIAVLDVDGPESVAVAILGPDHQDFLKTRRVRTGRGHHYYGASPNGPIPSDPLEGGAYVKGVGGYVLLPGSRHANGMTYTFENPEAPILEFPPNLIEPQSNRSGLPESERRRLLDGVSEGERHAQIYSLAGRFRESNFPQWEAEAYLIAVNRAYNKPPREDHEVIERVRDNYARYDDATKRPPAPQVVRLGDEFTLVWPALANLAISVEGVRELADGPQGEVRVKSNSGLILPISRLKLTSTTQTGEFERRLTKLRPDLPWNTLISQMREAVVTESRRGTPMVELKPASTIKPLGYYIDRLLPKDLTSWWYGGPESLKSLLSLAAGVSLASGVSILPFGIEDGRQYRVALLDWEVRTQAPFEQRLARLLRGADLPEDATAGRLFYRRQELPLTKDIRTIRRYLADHGIDVAFIDSFLWAMSGHDVEFAEATSALTEALGQFPCTPVIITHVSHATLEGRTGIPRPYGSIMNFAQGRSEWYFEAQAPSRDLRHLRLRNTKTSEDGRAEDVGLRVEFIPEAITITPEGLMRQVGGEVAKQIRTVLRTGDLTTKEIAERCGLEENAVRSMASRMRAAGEIVPTNTGGGRGNPTRWRLTSDL